MFHKFKQLIRLFFDSNFRFKCGNYFGVYKKISDEVFLKRLFRVWMGKELDLKNPLTFNEKLQWLKLFDRRAEYSMMVDKYLVKKFVSRIIGGEYVIPTFGVWKTFDDIDFDSLPNQFVLKCTHDSGGLVICRDKSEFDYVSAKIKIEKCLKKNFYYCMREWPYKNVEPRIIAEQYMEDSITSELRDYKFFCFDGVVKAMFVASDRQKEGAETKFDFFDRDFNHLDLTNGHPNALVVPEKPTQYKKMLLLAESLSKGIPEVRVDLYEANGRVYFGEFTFFHWSGIVPFVPEKWDYEFGSWIKLPEPTLEKK